MPLSLITLSMLTSPASISCRPPTAHLPGLFDGELVLQEIPAHMLLENVQQLTACMGASMQPTDEAGMSAVGLLLGFAQAGLQYAPAPQQGQHRPADGPHLPFAAPSDSGMSVTVPQFTPAPRGAPAQPPLAVLTAGLAALLPDMGVVGQAYTAMLAAQGTRDWEAIIGGTSRLGSAQFAAASEASNSA